MSKSNESKRSLPFSSILTPGQSGRPTGRPGDRETGRSWRWVSWCPGCPGCPGCPTVHVRLLVFVSLDLSSRLFFRKLRPTVNVLVFFLIWLFWIQAKKSGQILSLVIVKQCEDPGLRAKLVNVLNHVLTRAKGNAARDSVDWESWSPGNTFVLCLLEPTSMHCLRLFSRRLLYLHRVFWNAGVWASLLLPEFLVQSFLTRRICWRRCFCVTCVVSPICQGWFAPGLATTPNGPFFRNLPKAWIIKVCCQLQHDVYDESLYTMLHKGLWPKVNLVERRPGHHYFFWRNKVLPSLCWTPLHILYLKI